ncbi:Rod shape-determining protein MreB [Weissella viridescens]|uniref:Rod shape-determining protein MreB n=1 Tax=Weissella viridescens TaxID=1629 RepID=A0A380P959_WEIVI|nr:Rod shape-determining protein MreB [Weissella viridescens]
MHDSINQVVKAAHHVLAEIQPELSADVIDRGIVLTGGGALLRGIDQYLSDELGVPVMVSDSPLDNVAKGAGELLEHITKLTQRGIICHVK